MTRTARYTFLTGATLLMGATLIACAPLKAINAITPSATYVLSAAVPYGAGHRQQLDIYRPTRSAPPGGWPVVVFFYGGSWNSGERGDYRFIGEALAARGVITLIPDYRLYPEVRYPDFLDDSALALAWGLREAGRLGGNPARVFVMGHSAGGYNAAMLALDARWLGHAGQSPRALAGWVGLAGPYNFLPIQNPDAQPVFFHPDYPPGTQPLEHASRASPPALLAAASEDRLVNPQRNTVQLARKLQDQGVAVEVKLYEHVNHMTLAGAFAWPLRWLAPVLDDVSGFVLREDLALK